MAAMIKKLTKSLAILGTLLGLAAGFALPASVLAEQTVPITDYDLDLPKPLNDADIKRYQQIFDLQQDKKWKEADRLIKALDNDILLGRVLSQRYLHPTGWRSTYKQLRSWLANYNDHPAASRIYWLSKKRRPANAKSQKSPKRDILTGMGGHRLVAHM